ncbi:GldG family protein [bacterium]|nr:GldG family protein [FCB group bacterium]MBL7191663.1 GldG family protein [bacterium]
MKKKRVLRYTTFTTIILLLGILILINLISINIFTRVDLTEGKIFTLSKASKETVRNLEDRLTVKAYFSKDLPAPYSSNARYLKDQLDEYRANSNGRFHYEFVDPGSEEELEKEARDFQIMPVQVQVIESDKIEVKRVFMGLVFLYHDKHETIPIVQTTSGLEYEITSTVKKITADRIPNIGFLQGHGEPDPAENMTVVMGGLSKNYNVVPIDLTEGKTIPDTMDALFIISPTAEFSDWDLFCIDQFIMKGGKAAFLLNKIDANLQESRAVKANLNIDNFCRNFGFRINDDLVYDQHCGLVSIQEQRGWMTIRTQVQYPFFPLLTNFSQDNSMVRDLEDLGMFFPSSIDTSLAFEKGAALEVLVTSSEKSNRQTGRYDINPTSPGFKKLTFAESHIPLGITLIGSFSSYFKDKEIPLIDEFLDDKSIYSKAYEGEVIEESPETRLIVMGDGHFPQDIFMNTRSNADFFLNMADWLAQDESLIHIRTREVTARPLTEISEGLKRFVKYSNILAPSLIVILIGVIRWQIRRSKRVEI